MSTEDGVRTDSSPGTGSQPLRRAEAGSALIWALFFVTVTTGLLISHSMDMSANRKAMDVRYRQASLARNLARSGLTDATAWFRNQVNQPVTVFAPENDPGSDPPKNDTIDPALGLVREFEVRGSLWGRYEVRKDEILDVSTSRGSSAAGTVWDMGARGILYERVDPGRAFDQYPNRVLAMTSLRNEIRSIPVNLPAPAAVNILDPANASVGPSGKVDGGTLPAMAFSDVLGTSTTDAGGLVTGTPKDLPVANYDGSTESLFTLRMDQLMSFSDYVVLSNARLPASGIDDKIVFVDGNLTFPAGRSQRGRMLLVVNGDFLAMDGNDTRISGIVYVAGDATIRGPFLLEGMLVVGGNLVMGDTATPAVIRYQQAPVDALREALSRYRQSRAFKPATPGAAYVDVQTVDSDTFTQDAELAPLLR